MNILWLRSRLFWLGLIGLVFLIVMWGRHETTVIGGTFSTANGTYSLGWGNGTLRFGYLGFSHPNFDGERPEPGLKVARRPVPEGVETSNFAPLFYRDEFGVMNYLAIWFIVAVYFVFWYIGLLWLRP